MSAQCSLPEIPQQISRVQGGILIPTSSISNPGIQLTLARSNSKQMTSTAASNLNMQSSHQDEIIRYVDSRPMTSYPSLTSIPQRIVVTSNQQPRQGMTYIHLGRSAGKLPPVQRITLRSPNQQLPDSPDKFIAHRFTVKSVDRDSNKELSTSVERVKPKQAMHSNLEEILKEKIEVISNIFNERVAEQQSKSNYELSKLEQRLKCVQNDLNAKNEEVIRLKQAYEHALHQQAQQSRNVMNKAIAETIKQQRLRLSQTNTMNKEQMNKNFQYIAGRMRDLDVKIRLIVQNQQSINDNTQTNMKSSKLFIQQLYQVRKQFIEGCQENINKLKEKILQNIQEKQIKVQILEQQLNKISSFHNSNEQLITSLMQKVNLADQFKLLKQIAQKVAKVSTLSNIKLDQSKLTSLQQQLAAIKNNLRQTQIKNTFQIKKLSQQIIDCHSSIIALTSKSSSENTKVLQLQSINQKQIIKIKDFQKKNQQLEGNIKKLTRKIQQIEAIQQQNKLNTKKSLRSLQEQERKNLQLQRKNAQTENILANTANRLKQACSKITLLQQKCTEYNNSLKKAQQNLKQSTSNYQNILKKTKTELNQVSQKEILKLKDSNQTLLKNNSQLSQMVSQLTKTIGQHDKKVIQLQQLLNKALTVKQNLESQNKQLQQTIKQLNLKFVDCQKKHLQSDLMTKTQSIQYNSRTHNNLYQSKISIKSQNQILSLKKIRSNKIESSDEDSGILHRQISSKNIQFKKQGNQPKWFKEDLPEKLIKLKTILKLNRIPLPLACEIDQTGYLKDRQEGTYIYDNQGNLFVLNKEEKSRAVINRIISL